MALVKQRGAVKTGDDLSTKNKSDENSNKRPFLAKDEKPTKSPGKCIYCCNCLETLNKYQEDLEKKAQNAFARSKWGMFAYYKAHAVHIRRVHLNMRKGAKLGD